MTPESPAECSDSSCARESPSAKFIFDLLYLDSLFTALGADIANRQGGCFRFTEHRIQRRNILGIQLLPLRKVPGERLAVLFNGPSHRVARQHVSALDADDQPRQIAVYWPKTRRGTRALLRSVNLLRKRVGGFFRLLRLACGQRFLAFAQRCTKTLGLMKCIIARLHPSADLQREVALID